MRTRRVRPVAYRQGDKLELAIPMFADDDPADAGVYDPTNHGTTVVREHGEEVGRRDDIAGLGTFTLPPGPGVHTVTADASRPASEARSRRCPPTPAPSGRSTSDAGRRSGSRCRSSTSGGRCRSTTTTGRRRGPLRGGLTVATQPGARAARIRSVSVEMSYDEGATWQRATG